MRHALLLLPFLAGCLPGTATSIESPAGTERYELVCPEGAVQCMHDAGKVCGSAGFTIESRHANDYVEQLTDERARPRTHVRREVVMRVSCQKP